MKSVVIASIILLFITSCNKQQYTYPFLNPDLPIDERIDDLLGRLTPEEKVGQMMN